MADYTLKVQVDASQLRSQLQAALGSMKMGKMFAGGGGTGGGGMAVAGGTPSQIQKLLEKQGRLMDLQIKRQESAAAVSKKGWMGKFGPGLMKLAGITMGLAALRQVGTALIDASPLLQAMSKIGHTAFTLFLRPFGDLVGFLLRPFLILMLKWGIKFYKKFGGAAAFATAADVTTALEDLSLGGTEEANEARERNRDRLIDFFMMIFKDATDAFFGEYTIEDLKKTVPTAGAWNEPVISNTLRYADTPMLEL